MRIKAGGGNLLWSLGGMVLLALLLALLWHFRPAESPAEQLAQKASRVDLVSRMQVALASSSEAEKSAVLATTDEDSRALAGRALAALAEVGRAREELVPLLARDDFERERALLARFSEDFARLQRLEEEILGLAVQNTNVKAYALAYGPAADSAREMESALSRLQERHARPPEAQAVFLHASRARIALLHLQVLLPPHIAEESNEKMDRLEAAMTAEVRQARQELERLAALPALSGDPMLAEARAHFATFLELEARILALSRQNTNVASLALSLDKQRKAMGVCVEALNALMQTVLDEPIAGVTYGRGRSPTR